MKCKACGKLVEFPIYEEEVIIQTQPYFGANAWSTTPTGRTMPVCPFCNLPLYDDAEVKEGWIRGPRKYAEEIQDEQLRRDSIMREAKSNV